ncbi:MAG TPA: outer membrane protein assembly factor BamB [Hydrogenophaga sp.]|nr:outer membrane protein assembly factor BamB [Hydrogenophaga sp.]
MGHTQKPLSTFLQHCLLAGSAALLVACSSGPEKPKPAPLPPVTAVIGVQQAWNAQVGESSSSLAPYAVADRVYVASSAGTVAALDAATGRDVWRINLGTAIAAGVGSDGETAAVVTRGNELVAITGGKEIWRVRLPARTFTAPLVAGKRVFLLMADRSVLAFDGQSGARLWNQSRTTEPLVLSQGGVLLAVGDTLVVGLSGRLVGLNPLNGSVRWEAPVGSSRGTNEVERLVDLVGPVSRVGNSVCVRAYSAAVGCVDTARGVSSWIRPAQGIVGVHGDENNVFGVEANGRVQSWKRSSGEPAWHTDRLLHRSLSAPLAVGRVVVVGDSQGTVHVLSREDGSEMNRLTTDGSPVLMAPIMASNVLVVQTRNGGVYAWRPQ